MKRYVERTMSELVGEFVEMEVRGGLRRNLVEYRRLDKLYNLMGHSRVVPNEITDGELESMWSVVKKCARDLKWTKE